MESYCSSVDTGASSLELAIQSCSDIIARLDTIIQRAGAELVPVKCLILTHDDTTPPFIVHPAAELTKNNLQKSDSCFASQWNRIRHALLVHGELLFKHIASLYLVDKDDYILRLAKSFVLGAHCQQIFKALETCVLLAAACSCSGSCRSEQRLIYSLMGILQATKRVLTIHQKELSCDPHLPAKLSNNKLDYPSRIFRSKSRGSRGHIKSDEDKMSNFGTLLTTLKKAKNALKQLYIDKKVYLNPTIAHSLTRQNQTPDQSGIKELLQVGKGFVWAINSFLDEIVIMDQFIQPPELQRVQDNDVYFEDLLNALQYGKVYLTFLHPVSERSEPDLLVESTIDDKSIACKGNNDILAVSADTLSGDSSSDYHIQNEEKVLSFSYEKGRGSTGMILPNPKRIGPQPPIAYRKLADHLVSLDELRIRSRLSLTDPQFPRTKVANK
ncbi:hypothetical protein BASA61_010584 [Batrachochytrium salamandrivorans]|nr:hypothetical protein BASA61_010584 [Batrachochytrium salamandrivorans]KAH9277123.1 hypothetical protein BASA83_000647 [Batrachochytrium salamandrivorans]